VRSACASFLGCPNETFAELSRSLLCTLVWFASADTPANSRRPADARWGLEAFLGGPLGGIFKTYGRGCACDASGRWTEGGRKVDGRWTEGGRKVDGRWTEGGQRTPVSVSSSKRPPRRVRQPSSGFSAGSQRVSRRCSEGALFVGSLANGSTWIRFRPVPAERLTCGAPTAPTATRIRARGFSPIPEFGGLP
jgi:hypothetical protein